MSATCDDDFAPRLWVYTNFDCNLQCTYCCASSSPRAERRALSLSAHRQLVDEAAAAGINDILLTGGEPFLLPDIAERICYAAERIPTTVLTNAMLFRGPRLAALRSLDGMPVRFQVSVDGPCAEAHDAVRGSGSWARAIDGIGTLQRFGFEVHVSTTETVHNAGLEAETRAFIRSLGVAPEAHFFRPLARRGFSADGIEVTAASVVPEVTVSRDGVFWHPLACEDDFLVTRRVFPFAAALAEVHERFHAVLERGELPRPFR